MGDSATKEARADAPADGQGRGGYVGGPRTPLTPPYERPDVYGRGQGGDIVRRRARTTGAETQGLVPQSVLESERWESVAKGGEHPTIKEPKGVRILGMRFLDSSILECTSCAVPFTTTNRRHWCRRCGRIFCDLCTLKRQQIYTGGPMLRVCRKCALPWLFRLPIPVMQHIASFHDSPTLAVSLHVCHRFQLSINLPYPEVRNIHDIYDKNATKYLQKGAFGCVYSAAHQKTKTLAAIKVIDKYHVYSLREWSFIEREILLHKELNHSHIVKLHDVYQTRSKVYIVMDLGKGDLFDYMMARGYMTEQEVLSIAIQLLTALEYLHRVAHIVHRDVKPENVLVFDNPPGEQFPIVKLCDFGLAKRFESSTLPQMVSCTPCGTLNYCPPEVLTKAGPTTTDRLCKLDIFSLGILLHVLISGNEPFKGKSSSEILRNMQKPLMLSGSEWENISKSLKTTVASMLKYKMPMRPTATEALMMLTNDTTLAVRGDTIGTKSASGGSSSWHAFMGDDRRAQGQLSPGNISNGGMFDTVEVEQTSVVSTPPQSPALPLPQAGPITSAIPMTNASGHFHAGGIHLSAASKSPAGGLSVPFVSSSQGAMRLRNSHVGHTPILEPETFKDRVGLVAMERMTYRVEDGITGEIQVETLERSQRTRGDEAAVPDDLLEVHTGMNFGCYASAVETAAADPTSEAAMLSPVDDSAAFLGTGMGPEDATTRPMAIPRPLET